MGRLLAFNLVFFMLPFGVYAAWLFVKRGAASNAGDWPMKTISWLALVGAVLMLAAIFTFIQFNGAPPGSVYVPAQLIDGELVPGRYE
ncbi:MAG: hypothetical protein GY798_14310 [Hyphomicrobiales bacterium]|nr:hypothetical protein [Hyphomicrobiales bacterium]